MPRQEYKTVISDRAIKDSFLKNDFLQEDFAKAKASEFLITRDLKKALEMTGYSHLVELRDMDRVVMSASEIDKMVDYNSSLSMERPDGFIKNNASVVRYTLECPSDDMAKIVSAFLEEQVRRNGGHNPIVAINNSHGNERIPIEQRGLTCELMSKTGQPYEIKFVTPLEVAMKHEIAELDKQWYATYDKNPDSPKLAEIDKKIAEYQGLMSSPKDIDIIISASQDIDKVRRDCVTNEMKVEMHKDDLGFTAFVVGSNGENLFLFEEQHTDQDPLLDEISVSIETFVRDELDNEIYQANIEIEGNAAQLSVTQEFEDHDQIRGQSISYDPETDKFESEEIDLVQ